MVSSCCGTGGCAPRSPSLGLMYDKGRRCPPGRRRGSPVVSSRCGTGGCPCAVQPRCDVRRRTRCPSGRRRSSPVVSVSLRNRGMRWAQARLDVMLELRAPDDAEAVRSVPWRLRTQEALRTTNRGWTYNKGDRYPRHYAEAVRWYRLAAEQGDARAQTNLGWMYENGRGVPRTTQRPSGGTVSLRNRGMRGAVQPGCGCTTPDEVFPRTTQKQSGGTVSLRNRGMRSRSEDWMRC